MSANPEITLSDVPLPDDIVVIHEGVGTGIQHMIQWLVDVVHTLGYPGIFIMTFLESTFMPIPSEVTMIPAGYLVQQGQMNLFLVLLCSITGTIGGALFNYYIAYHYGRRFINAYGKYFFFGPDKMEKLDKFFYSHGEISTFTGRLVPGLRHFISFPAGLAKMDLKKFCIYTGVGGAIWMSTLVGVGYLIGGNKKLIKTYMPYVSGGVIVLVILMIVVYIWRKRNKTTNIG
ncbi:MAG: DedA family protein [Rickettsiales bacterium]|nr:DedA family protein [Rickettsiales bacterium]